MNSIEKALQRKKEKERAVKETQAQAPDEPSTIEKATTQAKAADSNMADQRRPKKPDVAETTHDSEQKPIENTSADYMLDLDKLEMQGHVSLSGKRSHINEEYREIKRKLLQNAFGNISSTLRNPNIIMVTSARPSEGKTFTATNLALSIAAEQDKTVLLVDADVLKPNVLKTLGLAKKPGIMDYLLADQGDLAEVLYSTNIDKLKIIPAGKSHHLSTELLASSKMHETIDEFASRYSDRVVIIDTPPLIGITESAILANFAGQAVVVVEEGRSRMRDIDIAVGRLNPDMAIGFVVNKSVNADAEGTGYYGYYYGADRTHA